MTIYCSIVIPVRLPLLNVQLRMHHRARSRSLRVLAWEVRMALAQRKLYLPPKPFTKAVLRVFRHSTHRPDHDNLQACVKGLCDVLQPLHDRNPCGLGVIANDAPDCLTVYVEHRQSKAIQTDIDIEDLSP